MLPLRSRDIGALLAAARQQWGGSTPESRSFDGEALILDLRELPAQGAALLNWQALLDGLRQLGLQPVALVGLDALSDAERAAAQAQGLHCSQDEPARLSPGPSASKGAPEPAAAPAPTSVAAPGPRCVVIDRPLRSGQQVYARGADLVVLGLVSHGAEVIADGSVHVYGALRGRAIAGAKGDGEARIYAQCLEAELLAVAGTFRTSEKPLPTDVAGRPAQVRLDGERLVFEPLNY